MSVPDNRRNLLLVDNTVPNYTQIVNSVNTSISDVLVLNPNEHTYANIVSMIQSQTVNSDSGYKSIGILQHNMRLPYYQSLKKENKCTQTHLHNFIIFRNFTCLPKPLISAT